MVKNVRPRGTKTCGTFERMKTTLFAREKPTHAEHHLRVTPAERQRCSDECAAGTNRYAGPWIEGEAPR